MRDRLLIICGIVGFLLLVTGAIAVTRLSDPVESHRIKKEKTYRRTLAEGISVTRHGVYGGDFVKCGSCRLEKRKKGMLTFGGLNVLVLDDLSIVLPPPEDSKKEQEESGNSPRDLVRRLGVSDGFLSGRGMPIKFSGLRITGLSVSRLADGNKAELIFSARTAEAVRGGLELKGCAIVRLDGRMEDIGKAMLVQEKKNLRLVWSGGKMDLM